ncbi:MAG TPA: hypothetical protein VFE47_32135 [Tepidisphaeraceae bacterium]|nr:hypothetical protein [Tepidisphaeraceae bacterium]
MTTAIASYIEERIRRPAPPNCCIIRHSTPVVSFGDAQQASIATLGLNPSRVEFVDDDGVLLINEQRRLANDVSLKINNLAAAPASVVRQVLEDCNGYFSRRPYWRWFDQLTPTLAACGAAYRDGSACHLDLVQWATDPTWGNLRPGSLRKRLVEEDAEFLAQQLRQPNIRLLLVNGRGAIRQLRRSPSIDITLDECKRINESAVQPTVLFSGLVFNRVRVVGWTTNLQSSFGVTDELRRSLLPTAVARLI